MPTTKYPFERYLNVRGPSFSPDGKRISFLTDITGVAEVWSIPIDTHASAPAWPDQFTFRGERVAGASYSPTDDLLPDPLGHRGCLR
jgi:Tol biopolymer transport system component